MPSITTFPFPIFGLLAVLASARTDLTGCTTTDVSSPAGASVAWYVPGTGERCDFLDCGGGRAPPKYSVPGCPQYTGTETYSPSYLAGYAATSGSQAAETGSASGSDNSIVQAVTTSSASIYSSAHTESSNSVFAVPTTSKGFDTTVTGSATLSVAASDKPLICALQATSDPNCGVSWSTTTSYESTSTAVITGSDGASGSASEVLLGASTITGSVSVSASVTASGSASRSLTLSLHETVPNKTSTAGATGSESSSVGGSASAAVSTGAAAAGMKGMIGGLSFVVVAVGAVVVM